MVTILNNPEIYLDQLKQEIQDSKQKKRQEVSKMDKALVITLLYI